MTSQLTGYGIGQKIAIGTAFCFSRAAVTVERTAVSDVSTEIKRLATTTQRIRLHLNEVADALKQTDEHSAEIILGHIELLDDPGYLGKIESIIQADAVNAEFAVDRTCQELVEEFLGLEDEYFRERASDIKDISSRIIADLSGVVLTSLADISQPSIVVADDLLPSDTAQLNPDFVLGFCTQKGSATSHTALLANSLGIPAVVGCGTINANSGDTIIVDGKNNTVIINPSSDLIEQANLTIVQQKKQEQQDLASVKLPAISADNIRCQLLANMASTLDTGNIIKYGAEGIGLLRTEFLFYEEETLPSEERQYTLYLQTMQALTGKPITIRTLDIGGDKPLASLQQAHEDNPFLGVRGIRLTNQHPQLFASQLKAIIRAATTTNADIKILFPFISTVNEMQTLLNTVADYYQQLNAQYNTTHKKLQYGAMIEIPSAALMIDSIFDYSDFVSIGTNDLAQYTCAADRTNEKVAGIADYCHPAILKLVYSVIQSAKKCHKDVSVCGEMAGDPLLIPLLFGMGLTTYSMAAINIPHAKRIIGQLTEHHCKILTETCLAAETAQQVRTELGAFIDTQQLPQ